MCRQIYLRYSHKVNALEPQPKGSSTLRRLNSTWRRVKSNPGGVEKIKKHCETKRIKHHCNDLSAFDYYQSKPNVF